MFLKRVRFFVVRLFYAHCIILHQKWLILKNKGWSVSKFERSELKTLLNFDSHFFPQILISLAKNTLLSNSINWPDYAKVPLKMESAAGYKILKIYSFFCFPDWLTMLKRTFQIALWSTKINKVVNLFFFQSEFLLSRCFVWK